MSRVLGRSPSRPAISRAELLGGAVVAVLAVLYPFAVGGLLDAHGVRAVALALLALGAVSLAFSRRRAASEAGLSPHRHLAFLGLAALAALLDDGRPLLFVPAGIQLVLFGVFRSSLAGGGSLLESAARRLQPRAPDFIRPYCRKVTGAWCAFFLANAAVIAGLAVWAPLAWWKAYSTWMLYALVGVFALGEYAIRKAWFRYYLGGPLDRVWAALLPAEKTPEGRRSMEYIRRTRRRMSQTGA